MNGLHTQILEFMTDIHPIKDEKDAKYYLSRLEMIPLCFLKFLKKWKKKKSKDFSSNFMVERVIGQIENIIDIPIPENPLVTIYEDKLTSIGMPKELINLYKKKASKIIKEKVLPSYQLLFCIYMK